MSYQLLQGISVSPQGNSNLGRFSKTLVNGTWPSSFAFGGWIYNATSEVGFSNQPSEIKLSIVLEVTNRAQQYAFFDIKDTDLQCGAGNGSDENWYNINFNGVQFNNFYLYEYEINIENNEKILSVTFKDYSLILDKIYVGLIKRQGDQFVYTDEAILSFPVICPDCVLAGNSINAWANVNRPLSYGSYVGIGGNTYDNFANIPVQGNIYLNWQLLFSQAPMQPHFDLNGGYLIIGTEEATEARCGDLAPVSYNFNELLASLRARGMQFQGAFPVSIQDADYIYHQNYVGSLREVLQQWCSDLGYDFYCVGKTFVGINLNQALDISAVVSIVDPTTTLGNAFALNQNAAITAFKTTSTLQNTFKQSVIVQNNRARDEKVSSKAPKRYVGILPLHPIDFNRHSNDMIIRANAFGNEFIDSAWTNNFEPGSNNLNRTLPELDGRTFGDIDTSIALTKYDANLRDIFCQDRAIYGETAEIQASNFRALGMVPLIQLTGDDAAMCIEKLIPENGDAISNICRDKRFYRVYLGYYYDQFKQDIISWEQQAAEAMYKYGFIARGLINGFPYFPMNSLNDESPTSGLYGDLGTSLVRIQHTVEPSAQQYYALRQAPFKDLILYSGVNTPSNVSLNIPLVSNNLTRTGLFPTGLFYASLDNEWGTDVEHFKRAMTLNLVDPCVAQFAQSPSYTQITNNIPTRMQDWKLDYFKPLADPDLESLGQYAVSALSSISGQTVYDKTVRTYYDQHYLLNQTCSKLCILVLTDTRQHPNIYAKFTPKGTEFTNFYALQAYSDKLRLALLRQLQIQTPDDCSLPLLQEICRNYLSGQFQIGPTGNPMYGCVIDEDKFNWLIDGFTYEYLSTSNSRGLNIQITKNPIRNSDTDLLVNTFANADINGDYYFSDVVNNQLQYKTRTINYNIVYPVTCNSAGGSASPTGDGIYGYYNGILTSQVDIDNRTPEIVDIFGTPVNALNNNTASLKIINESVDPDLQPLLDPFSSRFFSYMTVITGTGSIVTNAQQYYQFVKNLNNYEMTTPWKTVEMSLAGSPSSFGAFLPYLSPNSGLTKISMSVNDNGVTTNLSFSDRSKILPRQESVLNKIVARLK